MAEHKYYLKSELYELFHTDIEIFDFLQSGSLDGIWYWDLDRREEQWISPEFWQILGYEAATQPHKHGEFMAHLLREDVPVFEAESARHIGAPSQPFEAILRFRHADRSTVIFRCRGLLIRDEAGEPSRLLGVQNDLTRERRVELLLNETNRAARIGAWELKLETNELFWSDVTREIHGLPPSYVPEVDTAIEFYREGESRERIQEVLELAVTEGRPWNEELQLVTASGSPIWVRAVGQAEFVDGKPVRIFGSFQDIHEQKLRDDKLAEREQLLRQNFDLSPNGMVIAGVDGRLRRVSDSFAAMLGYGKEELLGESFTTATHPEDKASSEEMLKSFFEGAIQDAKMEKRYLKKTGEVVWAEVAVGVLRDAGGQPKSFHAQVADLTDSKIAEERKRRIAFLEDKSREMEQFAYIASHDLRQPLLTIRGFADVIAEDYAENLDAEALEYLRVIHKSVDRMDNLIRGLLDYSRLSQEKQLQQVDVNALIDDVIADLAGLIEREGARIYHTSMPKVYGYPIELQQLFQNLFANAITYRRPGVPPEVSVECRTLSGGFQLSVIDNGIGIEPKNFERIFGLFQQVSRSKSDGSTGIGLANCRTIVQRHGGTIWVESTLGVGSVFHFTLLTDKASA